MLKTIFATAVLAAAASTAALAQPAAPAPAPASAPAAGKLSVQTSKIGEIIATPAAKAALEKVLPEIAQYYDQISGMTLVEVAPMSGGALDDAKLKAVQAELDKIS